ncbi:hypothetical protein Mp_7g18580 [Marchantia polymorpha subsp. ruderalis]|uniref:Trafficking protein particle complex subunit 12 n=2 Tax=Marchantia polymorpha TaxID=3197 RepID=A0AAF6C155_MARPO|nr:hypothetical protein MARPO_0165s0018 [Marchantia polymorpha]BBN17989.1 hypothetical protein Mp_7g18580 [Marchantia polymorpha subsp. ruderalis]|eukprot:PTQ28391.1 hypothetical protein MARPO_0165s0018 [Marchantia polymorpha]
MSTPLSPLLQRSQSGRARLESADGFERRYRAAGGGAGAGAGAGLGLGAVGGGILRGVVAGLGGLGAVGGRRLERSHSFATAAAMNHPLMPDPPASSPPRASNNNNNIGGNFNGDSFSSSSESFSPPFPSVSASSAASATSSPPETVSSFRGPSREERKSWDANAFDARSSAAAFRRLSVKDASSDLAGLQQLMRQGFWRAIADKVKEAKKRSMLHFPDEQLVYSTYHVLALMKLRSYAVAAEELAAIGDLKSKKFRYEHHGDMYPGKTGSMVPFALRWLHAELPHRLGHTTTTIDHLYDLLAHCNERIDFLQNSMDQLAKRETEAATEESTPTAVLSTDQKQDVTVIAPVQEDGSMSPSHVELPSEEPALSDVGSNFMPSEVIEDDDFGEFVTSSVGEGNTVYCTLLNRWRRRQEVVLCSVLGHHLNQKDYIICLKWLEDLVKKRTHDVVVLSKYGYVQLQLGDLYGARRTFATVEAICEQQGRSGSSLIASLISRNRGLLYFSLKQYPKAVKEFDAVLELDPGDVVSANNKALCLMYSRDLVGATQVLETALQKNPLTALNETLVLNLCSMYELASMNSVESKRTLSAWILRIAPDDFDLTCTRL